MSGGSENLDGVSYSITSQMNENLTTLVDETEIKVALFFMNPNKSPRPNGMTPIFYSKVLEQC